MISRLFVDPSQRLCCIFGLGAAYETHIPVLYHQLLKQFASVEKDHILSEMLWSVDDQLVVENPEAKLVLVNL